MRSRENELTVLFILLDIILLNFSILFVIWLRRDISLTDFPGLNRYLLFGNSSWLLTYVFLSKKTIYISKTRLNILKRFTLRFIYFILISAVVAFIFSDKVIFFRLFLLEYCTLFFLTELISYAFIFFSSFYRKKFLLQRFNRSVILGDNSTAKLLRKIIDSNPLLKYQFVDFVTPDEKNMLFDKPVLEKYIREHLIQVVFAVVSIYNSDEQIEELIRFCTENGVRVYIVANSRKWKGSKTETQMFDKLQVINPQEIPLDNIVARFAKRTYDIVFSLMVIVFLLSWLSLILYILIKLESRGPLMFVQKRTGINNKTFDCYKFRSMVVNGDSDRKQATSDDKRITRTGKFIRRTNIDELPQFINVLKGEMSVVGPRPHMVKHTEEYSDQVYRYLTRHFIKPGVTGWAQVNGFRGETDELWKMEKRVEYDLDYIENWNFWLDIKITILTMLGKKSFMNAG